MDGTISSLFPERQKLEAQIAAQKESGLGSAHPHVKVLEAQLAEVDGLLKKGAEAVQTSLKTRLKIAQESLANLKAIEDEKDDSMEERKRYTQYVEAKRSYETQNLILTDMREALLKEKVDLSVPKSPIEIHEVAEPSEAPAKPNVPLNLLLGTLVGTVVLFFPFGIALMYFVHAIASASPQT